MDQIQHVIILMMENRSFDHYLGALRLEGRTDIEGYGTGPLPVNHMLSASPTDPGVAPFPLDDLNVRYLDPPHEWRDVRKQWNGGAMDGFVSNYQEFYAKKNDPATIQMAKCVMGYYTRKTLPVLYWLADNFVVCDHWFSSFLGSTHPNRAIANAGDCGDVLTTTWRNAFRNKPLPLWSHWQRAGGDDGISWRVYKMDSEPSQFSMWLGWSAEHDKHAATLVDFARDCKRDSLPNVAIIEPPYTIADDHPTHDPRRGQQFIGYILRTLISSPSWAASTFVLTYDEHGGFFDHVAPPAIPNGMPPRDYLGLRVPTIIASPHSLHGVGVSDQFDHVTILKSISERWQLPVPDSLAAVFDRTNSFWNSCFDFAASPPMRMIPPIVRASMTVDVDFANDVPTQSDFAASLHQMGQATSLERMEGLA